MSFKVIKGTFHVVGYSPDGDSIRFKAAYKNSWNALAGKKVKLNKKLHAQLRIEAIDTLETHYKKENQPEKFAKAATNELFNLLGIKNVVWHASGSKVKSADDGVPGYIMSRTTEMYGRPVSFIFSDAHSFNNGEMIRLTKTIAKKSINFQMLTKGLAYPTFYEGMFYDLRKLFADATGVARENKVGVWSKDRTNSYMTIDSLDDVTEKYVILPKLFRRIVAYIKDEGSFDANAFVDSLESWPEKVLMLNILHFTHFDNLLKVSPSGRLKLTVKPEDIVFMS